MSGDVIKIEQRLQEQGRFFFFTADEAVVLVLLILIGLVARQPIPLAVFAVLLWQGWKFLKGDGGLERLLAATYWYLPGPINPYAGLPDSAVALWRG